MSFGSSAKRAKDETKSIGDRYLALLQVIEFSHLKYHDMWNLIKQKYGVGKNDKLTATQINEIVDFVKHERNIWKKENVKK